MKRSGSLLAGLGLSLGLIGPACTVDKKHENTEVAGTLAVALVAQAGGNTYRLRNAIFTISGQSDLQLESEADPNSTELTAVLFPGNYNVLLEEGWAMERIDPAGDITVVQATLLDPNPIFAQVIPGSIANTRFRFTTNGQVVDFDLGSIRVTIAVEEVPPDAGGPVFPPCDPLTEPMCAVDSGCYPTDQGGLCAGIIMPPGGVAGDPCTFLNSCGAGLTCVFNAMGGTECAAICDSTDASSCGSGLVCQNLGFASLPDVGVCAAP